MNLRRQLEESAIYLTFFFIICPDSLLMKQLWQASLSLKIHRWPHGYEARNKSPRRVDVVTPEQHEVCNAK